MTSSVTVAEEVVDEVLVGVFGWDVVVDAAIAGALVEMVARRGDLDWRRGVPRHCWNEGGCVRRCAAGRVGLQSRGRWRWRIRL